MANQWTFEELFDELNDGALNGQGGWGPQGGSPYNYQVVTATSPQGTKHISYDGTTSSHYSLSKHSLSVESGTFYFSVKTSNTGNIVGVVLTYSPGILYIYFWYDGKIKIYDGTTFTDTGISYSANQWYRVGVQFETSSNGYNGLAKDKYKWNLDNGTWSSAYSLYTLNHGNITDIVLYSEFDLTNSGYSYFDFISPNYSSGQSVSVLDTISLTEDLSALRQLIASISDTINLTGSISALKGLVLSVSDTIGLTEAISALRARIVSISDSLNLTENISIIKTVFIAVSDSIGLDEAVNSVRGLVVRVADSISLTEVKNLLRGLVVRVSDGLHFSETYSIIRHRLISVADSLSLTEITSVLRHSIVESIVKSKQYIIKSIYKSSYIIKQKARNFIIKLKI